MTQNVGYQALRGYFIEHDVLVGDGLELPLHRVLLLLADRELRELLGLEGLLAPHPLALLEVLLDAFLLDLLGENTIGKLNRWVILKSIFEVSGLVFSCIES